jgi:hypothetical protein
LHQIHIKILRVISLGSRFIDNLNFYSVIVKEKKIFQVYSEQV